LIMAQIDVPCHGSSLPRYKLITGGGSNY